MFKQNPEEVIQLTEHYQPDWIHQDETGDIFMIVPLLYHVALYINHKLLGGQDDRYCFHNKEVAIKAANEFIQTGEMRYWQKWHNKNISISGSYAYPPHVFHTPENSIYKVDWNSDLIKEIGLAGAIRV